MPRPTSLSQVKWVCEPALHGYRIEASWQDAEGKTWCIGDSVHWALLQQAHHPSTCVWLIIHRMTCSLLSKSRLKKYPRFPFPDASGV